ncbi:TIGR01458 family HAD-type hydrolase [Aquihabitans daechungensis]|uniref:TIGR01458 family HAD-type hydrolase n=1 Tax=Aquihabitans daechungensis TaxID=1052257 RepID=UPI003BA16AFF
MGDDAPPLDVDGLLIDIDGVLTLSWEPIEGAPEAVERLRRGGVPMRFVTNTTSLTRAEVTERLHTAGMEVGEDDVLTAPLATAAWLAEHHPAARCHLVNSGDLAADLAALDLVGPDEDADVVLLGGAGPEFSYEALNCALGLLLDGAMLVAMHRNRYWRTAAGFALDTGAFVAALEQAAGVTATVVGKPSPDFFATAVRSLGVAPERAAMVGDDLDSDVLAAQAVGLHGVLVRTGKFREETLEASTDEPDRVIGSFADLPALLGTSGSR